jgi:hypothetical protein
VEVVQAQSQKLSNPRVFRASDLSCEPRNVTVDIADEALVAHFKEILRNLGYPLTDEENGFINSTTLKAKSVVSCAIGKFSDNKKKK